MASPVSVLGPGPWRVLVCGDRNYADKNIVDNILLYIETTVGIAAIIEGGARGADRLAAQWAERHDVPLEEFPADWDLFGKAAGPIRNRQMLAVSKPDMVVGFHDDLAASKGTADMLREAKKADVPVWHIHRDKSGIPTITTLAYGSGVSGGVTGAVSGAS